MPSFASIPITPRTLLKKNRGGRIRPPGRSRVKCGVFSRRKRNTILNIEIVKRGCLHTKLAMYRIKHFSVYICCAVHVENLEKKREYQSTMAMVKRYLWRYHNNIFSCLWCCSTWAILPLFPWYHIGGQLNDYLASTALSDFPRRCLHLSAVTEVIASSGVRTERFTVAGKRHSPLIICLCRTMRRSLAGRIGGYCLAVLLLGDLGGPVTRGRTDSRGRCARRPGRGRQGGGGWRRAGTSDQAGRHGLRPGKPYRSGRAADSPHLSYRDDCTASLVTISAAAGIVGDTSPEQNRSWWKRTQTGRTLFEWVPLMWTVDGAPLFVQKPSRAPSRSGRSELIWGTFYGGGVQQWPRNPSQAQETFAERRSPVIWEMLHSV